MILTLIDGSDKLCPCGAIIWFARTANGNKMPAEMQDGELVPHWGNCTERDKFKKKEKNNE